MRRVRKLKPMYEPPEGMMFNPYRRNRVVNIIEVQDLCRGELVLKSNPFNKKLFPDWECDPSYNWAEEVKAKRGKK